MSARKTKKRAGAEAPARCRKTITLPDEQARDLATYAAYHRRTESDVVSEALTPILKGRYYATRSAGRPGEPPSEGPPSPHSAE